MHSPRDTASANATSMRAGWSFAGDTAAGGGWWPTPGVVYGAAVPGWYRNRFGTPGFPGQTTGGVFTHPHNAAPGQGPAPFLSSGFATGLRC